MLLVAAPHLREAVIAATFQKASPSSPLSTLVSALIPVRSIRIKIMVVKISDVRV